MAGEERRQASMRCSPSSKDAVLNQKMKDIFINRQGVMLTDGTGEGRIWLMGGSSLGIIKIVND